MKARYMTVSDLMVTAVVTVRADELVRDAHADMELGAFRHLPVLDDRGKLVGIVSDRDILRALTRQKSTAISSVMTPSPQTVRPDMPAHTAAQLMLDHKFGSLPVVGDDGRLIGLITETDFVEVARRALLGLPLDAG